MYRTIDSEKALLPKLRLHKEKKAEAENKCDRRESNLVLSFYVQKLKPNVNTS